ncbi:MAG TPA: YjgN family protein [Casimicrobiaceae bacterium]|nr:YjgN family protein [Casimicrobiaceae bacterium]
MGETATAAPAELRFEFTGRTAEYFRIWAVSLCLSLATLGVYSAWGKVRKRRYLYAHTRLDGSGFDYRASPRAILRGRAIALALFGGLALAGHFVPTMQLVLFALLVLLAPWIVVASSRFNARSTTFRNVAFAFDGTVREAAKVLLGFGAIAIATAGIAWPWFRMRRARFIVEHHRFGATPFRADLEAGGFVLAYLLAFLMLVGVVTIVGVTVGIVSATTATAGEAPPAFVVFAPVIAIYAAYLVAYAYLRARVGNLTLDGTVVGALRGRSTLRARDLVWLYLGNVVAVLATLGLAVPWVTIRMARYRAAKLALAGGANIASFAAAAGAGAGAATGSEVGDLFDVDVSL